MIKYLNPNDDLTVDQKGSIANQIMNLLDFPPPPSKEVFETFLRRAQDERGFSIYKLEPNDHEGLVEQYVVYRPEDDLLFASVLVDTEGKYHALVDAGAGLEAMIKGLSKAEAAQRGA